MKKVSIIGAGNVGATAALFIAQKELADVVLLDIVEGIPQGKGLDMSEASPIQRFDVKVKGTNDYAAIADSNIVVVTAGMARKPGMDRLDLMHKNAKVIEDVSRNIAETCPEAIIIMITNPVDVMTYHAWKITGFPKKRVIGQAGVLDSARFATFISMELDVSVEDISPMVLGGHGDEMVPLPRYTTVSGIPITELLSQEKIEKLIERTRKGGAEIVGLLKTGSAFYAPGAAVAQMVEAILNDKKRILPCSVYLDGEYNIDDIFIGVPVKLGYKGVEDIIQVNLNSDELSALQNSAQIYKNGIANLYKK
ncbi:malate dehydrogenase [Candidatus Poribacteria bacterium]|nr:malate dehydrogenase [Candidatus Poribacteria bacterium]